MDKKISEIFDYGDEIVVVEERDDLFDPARIKELTMKKINAGGAHAPARNTMKKARPAYRTMLLAAVVAVLLVGTAFAVYQYGLKDMLLEERDDGFVDVSAVGWRDTPEYKAFVEWSDFQREYEQTHDELPDVKADGSIPIEYLQEGACTRELMDALDGILAKNGLTMHDGSYVGLPAEGVDLDAILLGDIQGAGGYAYRDGTMMLEVSQTLTGGETVDYQLFNAVKGTFSTVSGSMEDDAEEWVYTTKDGVEVSLIMGENTSMLVADMDRVFVTAHTVFRNVSGRDALEELADSIGWEALNEHRSFSQEYYTAYRADLEQQREDARLTYAAREELGGDWTLTNDICLTHVPAERGRASADSEDGTAWMEWTYTELEGEGIIRLRYERPAGDIAAAFAAKLAEAGAENAAHVLKDVPVYVRTETAEGPDIVTEYRDLTVYIPGTASGGAATALWLDEDKDLIFTLSADPGELTGGELEAQVAYLLGGREPFPMQAAPEVVWARLGHYEPAWLPEGWRLEPEMAFATAMTADGSWSGRFEQAYVTGEAGKIIWFSYETAEAGTDPRAALRQALGYEDGALEELAAYGVTFTDTTVNGHPALLKEGFRSAVLVWIDEDAGVRFGMDGDDAAAVRAMAESVAAQ